jgi:hypothetical protein
VIARKTRSGKRKTKSTNGSAKSTTISGNLLLPPLPALHHLLLALNSSARSLKRRKRSAEITVAAILGQKSCSAKKKESETPDSFSLL